MWGEYFNRYFEACHQLKIVYSMEVPRFHLAFPVHDLKKARVFYAEILGCEIGRSSDKWIDFNLYGHQIVAHLSPQDCSLAKKNDALLIFSVGGGSIKRKVSMNLIHQLRG